MRMFVALSRLRVGCARYSALRPRPPYGRSGDGARIMTVLWGAHRPQPAP